MLTPGLRSLNCALLLSVSGCASTGVPDALRSVPLVTTREDGVADSQVVPVRYEDEEAWLALDTGAPFSFLFADPDGPEFVERAGTVEIAGQRWELPGYGDDGIGIELFQERPIVGVLGLDFFFDRPSAIDYPAGRLERCISGSDRRELTILKLKGRAPARALVEVVLDGQIRTMLFDTGAHDSLLLGVTGHAVDQAIEVQTADGVRWPVSEGLGRLELPGEPARTIPLMRAQEIGYISPMLKDLEAQGLLGLTALGWRRIELDFQAGELRLGSRRLQQ